MSDQIAVLADGRVEQVGPPQEIYSSPATTFVAGFLGAANIFDAEVVEVSDDSAICAAIATRLGAVVDHSVPKGPAAIVIRPERIALQGRDEPVRQGYNAISGTVAQIVYLGACTQVHVDVGAATALVVEVPNASGPASVVHPPGAAVTCVCAHDAVRVLHRSAASLSTDLLDTEADEALSPSSA